MVSSYARYLGLDSEDITKQFLSEYHEFENREARRPVSPLDTSTAHLTRPEIPNGVVRMGRSGDGQGVRSMWDKPIPSSELNRGYDSRSSAAQRVATAASRRRRQPRDSSTASRYGGDGYTTPRQSLPARVFGALFGNPAVLVIMLVLVVVIGLVVWAMVANSCRKQTNDVIIPANTGTVVTEGTPAPSSDDTEGTGTDENDEGEAPDDSRYGPFELVVTPAEGTAPWTEVSVNGENVYAGTLSEEMTWEVSASCDVLTAQPHNLTVTRNGEAVELVINDSNGSGSVSLEVEEAPANGDDAAAGNGEGNGDDTAAGNGTSTNGEGSSAGNGGSSTNNGQGTSTGT
jgi:cytoskeletal protein RodZ